MDLSSILSKQTEKEMAAFYEEQEEIERRGKQKKRRKEKCTPLPLPVKANDAVGDVGDVGGVGSSSATSSTLLPMPSPPPPKSEFRPKRRASSSSSSASEKRPGNLLDFVIENPYDGKLKDLTCVKDLVSRNPNTVFSTPTSYCHYGYDYRKRTLLIHTLADFKPTLPCPEVKCSAVKSGKRHAGQVVGSAAAKKNSIPPQLVKALMDAWLKRVAGASDYLVIDVFSGWGSVSEHIRAAYPNIKVYSNDIVDRNHMDMTLDMKTFTLGSLLVLAATKLWSGEDQFKAQQNHKDGIVGWFKDERIAVLWHISTPCETYSQNGLGKHRVKGTTEPKTHQAVDADAMNARITEYVTRVVLDA